MQRGMLQNLITEPICALAAKDFAPGETRAPSVGEHAPGARCLTLRMRGELGFSSSIPVGLSGSKTGSG